MNSPQHQRRLPLDGVRVLELGNYIAAPTAGRMLADFGAEVIKIERETGDELRNWRLYDGETSMLFRTINRNKKSVVLDLKTEQGREDVKSLAAHCDVVLENFRPGTLERWGLGPEALSEANPDLIFVRISAFGQTGPYSERPGFAAVAEAYGGFRELVGDPDRPPVRVGVSIGDSIAGLYGAFGAVMALYERLRRRDENRGGDGEPGLPLADRIVDVALNEAIFSMMESLVPDLGAYGVKRERTGGRMEGIAPSNGYLCRDGSSVVISGNADAIFPRYMRAIGRDDLADDPDLATNDGRWRRRDEIDAAIGEWTGARSRDEVLAVLDDAAVPAGPIYTAADIVADEQYRARNMIQEFDVDAGGPEPRRVAFPGIVPVLGETSLPIRSVGPDLGEHTDEIRARFLGGRR
ncbi:MULTISPECIES: CaiB/BaiF CoA transferase family protein [Gordonia]|uniref:CaiB/BaiF family protein n=2 Tax=Gordonia TaxID=2053 RepID=L7LI99_9ACTN|nr:MULTISPECIES: CoA transferase [Gordonia]AUH69240.1 CoA transferase [Gordonia sp. YC-JH1]KJR04804.1 CoA-transferase [Gordonia sihwensis]KXT57787.1 CoA-transferase [Gordonia sp. QH-12]WFN94461.1 CoA transferase [Gordonia sihwensis]GAC60845.1 CaiB/BaiF family protein [Gordonia sihwensis NBRC 108236]